MADKRVSVPNVDTEENAPDGAEGNEPEKQDVRKQDLMKKRQKSRSGSKGKKKERVFNWPLKNLYDATYTDSVTGLEKNLIHRCFIISKLEEGITNRSDVGNHFDQFFKMLKSEFQSEPITGLMLIYMRHIVHVVETSADMILELAKELAEGEDRDDAFICKSKILVISHDIPHRQYQSWGFRTLDIVEPGLEAYEPGDSTENLVVDLLTQLLRLGNFLAKQPKLNLKNAMDSLHDKVPELLPQQAVVHYLLEDSNPCIMTPEEYVDIYRQPFDITLDSDMVWPLPTKLFPYS